LYIAIRFFVHVLSIGWCPDLRREDWPLWNARRKLAVVSMILV